MNGAPVRGLAAVLAVVGVAAAPACATSRGLVATSSPDPHARALVLAMDHDAAGRANTVVPDCRPVTWTVVRPAEPGYFDTTGRLHVRVCRAGVPCRDSYVEVRDGTVLGRPDWKATSGAGSRPSSLPPIDVPAIRARLPRPDAALLAVVAREDPKALLGNLEIDPWFDVETRTWRAEPARSEGGDAGCDRWNVDLRIGDVEILRWTVDLSVDSVSRRR